MANQYQQVTDRIIAALERGAPPWRKPWTANAPAGPLLTRPLRSNGAPYRGANVLNLWAAGDARGFASPFWMTYNTAQELGAQVRKGARSEFAFYVGKTNKTEERDGQEIERTISFLKAYCVFNADEIEGLPAYFYAPAPVMPEAPPARNARVDAFVTATGAAISHGGDRAFYVPSTDRIQMPHLVQFQDVTGYYSTLLHELTHWTSAEARCNRTLGRRFGDDAYAAEELVAELGAAYLCADLALSNEPRPDHASYLAEWIRVLKADNRAIFTAAALAEKAAEFLHGAQAKPLPMAA